MTKKKKLTISAVAAFILVSAAVFVLAALPDFSGAALKFSGIHMVKTNAGVQGLVDISLKNIDTPALSFCIEYDTSYVQLSNYADNTPLSNPTSTLGGVQDFDTAHTYFNQNTDAFPDANTFKDNRLMPVNVIHAPIVGIADHDNGRCIMTFIPNDSRAVSNSDYIEWRILDPDDVLNDTQPVIITQTKGEVSFGQLSFFIKDPLSFSKLTPNELENIIKIIPFSRMVPEFLNSSVSDPGIADDFGMHMAYYDEDYDLAWYPCSEDNIEYDLDIDLELESVSPQVETLTVSSYDIFNNGSKSDLIDFLNEKMSMLTLEYADGSQVPKVFKWDENQSLITKTDGGGAWDPKGGTYEIEQRYNDDFSVKVTVIVTPVTLLGLTADNQSITYYAPDIPTDFGGLSLPNKARPVLDTYIPNGGIPELTINMNSYDPSDIPAQFQSGGAFTFTADLDAISQTQLLTQYKWLTYSQSPKLTVNRYVVTDPDKAKILKASAVTDDSGVMTITVNYEDNSSIPSGTTFDIKLPNGRTFTNVGATYAVVADGSPTATITLDPDIINGNDDAKLLARMINLGSRAGTFSIRADEPGEQPTMYADFIPDPRNNYYERPDTGGDYEFDYSAELAAMFPVQQGQLPSTTVTLPRASDRIITTYDGYDGNEKGYLQTFTVTSWNVNDGDINTVGSVVSVTGVLADTEYTNYGKVTNNNNVQVTIKYLVVEKTSEDLIDDIPDTVFSTQQVGYDYDDLETKTFRIRNRGRTDIYGLSAVIEISSVSGNDDLQNAEAFLLTRVPLGLLERGASTTFDITTKFGLPVGTYTSKVTIYSNNKELDTFNISFTVTEEDVYKITVKSNDENYGTAKTEDGTTTATEGTQVTLVAEPETDCEFVGWSSNGSVEFQTDSGNPLKATFTMPPNDIEITAEFRETLGAKLRATELYVKDTDDVDQDLHDSDWAKINYDPATREYYVAVPNETDKVKVWFKPRSEISPTITMTHDHDSQQDPMTYSVDMDDGMYKSSEITLDVSPIENKVILQLEYDDPEDDPDAGKVTRQYVIHIYRKLQMSELMQFAYGNSPYGLIMRDNGISSADKQTVKDAFVSDGYQFKSGGTVPANASADVVYTTEAWDGSVTNYDLSDTALFVTDVSSFTDPGFTKVQNSIGASVDASGVTKSVQVNVLTETNSDAQNGSAEDFVKTARRVINLPASGPITELGGMRIRPDIYYLTYKFTDFDGTTASVTKPLIILSGLGDVNISKTVDDTDVTIIARRFGIVLADNNSLAAYRTGGYLNRYRIQDVNKDGYVNAIDANFIRAKKLDPFYKNIQ